MQNEGGHGLALITATTLYVLLAAIGLSVGTPAAFVTPVWPASGFASGILIGFGARFWPAVAGRAVITHLRWGLTLPGSLGMALAETGKALLGWCLLTRVVPIHRPLDWLRDVALKNLGCTAAACVISGDVAKPIQEQATRGVGAFFSKPIRPQDLHRFLRGASSGG